MDMLTSPSTSVEAPASPTLPLQMPPLPVPTRQRKRRRQTAQLNKEVSICKTYGVKLPSETVILDAGLLLTGVQAFTTEFDILHYCIGGHQEEVYCFIRFSKP